MERNPTRRLQWVMGAIASGVLVILTMWGCRLTPDSSSDSTTTVRKAIAGQVLIRSDLLPPPSVRTDALTRQSASASFAIRSGAGETSNLVPLASAEVWLEAYPSIRGVTDENGNYYLQDPPDGNQRVIVKGKGNNPSGTVKMRTGDISVTGNSSVTNVDGIIVEPAINVVSGCMRDSQGNPLPRGSKMSLWGEEFEVGDGGIFTTPPLPEGFPLEQITLQDSALNDQLVLTVGFISDVVPMFVDVQAPPKGSGNSAPVVFLADRKGGVPKSEVQQGEQLQLVAQVADPDEGDLNQVQATWECTKGTIVPVEGKPLEAIWTAPYNPGNASILVRVTDPSGGCSSAKLMILVGKSASDPGVPLEIIPPVPLSRFPLPGATGVPLDTAVTITFDEPLDQNTVSTQSMILTTNGGSIRSQVKLSEDQRTISLQPILPLHEESDHHVAVLTKVTDVPGNPLTMPIEWDFRTGRDASAPFLLTDRVSPASGATDVSSSTAVTIVFNEPVQASTVTPANFTVSSGSTVIEGVIVVSEGGRMATFTPVTPYPSGSLLTVSVGNGVQDLSGNSLLAPQPWTFSVSKDTTSPVLVSMYPASGSYDISSNIKIGALFSEAVAAGTVSSSTCIVSSGPTVLDGSWSVSGSSATFTPAMELPLAALITVTMTNRIQDLDGNPFSGVTWNFRTRKLPNPPVIDVVAGDDRISVSEKLAGVVVSGTCESNASVAVDLGGLIRFATMSGTAWSYALTAEDFAGLGEGSRTIIASAFNGFGLASEARRTIWIDTSNPLAPVFEAVAGDDALNLAEKKAGVTLRGSTELNASVTLVIGWTVRNADVNAASWSYLLTPADYLSLGEGTQVITASATDQAGNVGSSAHGFLIDTIVPAAPGIGIITGDDVITFAEKNAGVTITGTNETDSRITLSISGNTRTASVSGTNWSYTLLPEDYAALGQGNASIIASATDVAGNASGSSRNFFIDTIVPTQPTIDVVAFDDIINANERSAGVTLTGSLDTSASLTLSIGGMIRQANVSGVTWSYPLLPEDYANMGEGGETIVASATDAVGNATQTSRTITIDTSMPEVVLANIPPERTGTTTILLPVSGASVVEYRYRLDGSEWSAPASVTSSLEQTGLSLGDHVLEITGRDDAGNWGPVQIVTWTVLDSDMRCSLGGGLEMTFQWIDQEKFDQGRTNVATPTHSTTLSRGFFLGTTEVTQKQYEAVTGGNPSVFRYSDRTPAQTGNQPVENVSWYDALRFCNALSEAQYYDPCYYSDSSFSNTTITDGMPVYWKTNADGFRLPTEAEWECAARARTQTGYSWGDIPVSGNMWYEANSTVAYIPNTGGKGTHDAALTGINPYGLFDMNGNISEWCWDWYGTYIASNTRDPIGPDAGLKRIIRGGSWLDTAEMLVAANRSGELPASKLSNVGFRVARSIDPLVVGLVSLTMNPVTGDNLVNAAEKAGTVRVTGGVSGAASLTLYIGQTPHVIPILGPQWSYVFTPQDFSAMGEGEEPLVASASDEYGGETVVNMLMDIDTVPPRVATDGLMPPRLSSGASQAAIVTVRFTEPVNPETLNPESFTIFGGVEQWLGTVQMPGSSTVAFTPSQEWPLSATVTVALATYITDLAGNPLQEPEMWAFRVQDPPVPLTVMGMDPASGSINVDKNTLINIGFSELLDPKTVASSTIVVTARNLICQGTLTYANATVTVDLQEPLPDGATVTVTLLKAITGVSGNTLAANTIYSFRTEQKVLYVKADAIGANDGTCWADAFTNLTTAIDTAVSGQEVWVASGVYKPTSGYGISGPAYPHFRLKNGVGIYGGFLGHETQRSQRDFSGCSILSGDLDGNGALTDPTPSTGDAYHVIYLPQNLVTDPNTVLDGFLITGGNAADQFAKYSGGGLYSVGNNFTLRNCRFVGNNAAMYGGGLYISQGTVTIEDCEFIYNTASMDGGGIRSVDGSFQVIRTKFFLNSAGGGGGISDTSGIRAFRDCIFSGNSAVGGDGGGVKSYIYQPPMEKTYSNCLFSGNVAGGSGGGLFDSGGIILIANSTFSGNHATSWGGGGHFVVGMASLTNSIFWGNHSSSGNGHQIYSSMFNATMDFCTSPNGVNDITIEGGGGALVPTNTLDPAFFSAPSYTSAPTIEGNFYLQDISPCLEGGSNTLIPVGVTTDLSGNPRTVNGVVDMGAFERQEPISNPPWAPRNLVATVTTEVVTLTWNPSAGATSYSLYYSSSPGVTKSTGTAIHNVTSPHTMTGLTQGTWYFVVTAHNGIGESSESNEVSATIVKTFALQFGSKNSENVNDICVDPIGNSYITGCAFGAMPGCAAFGGNDGYVAKVSPDGKLLWIRQFGSASSESGQAVWADSTGVYVAGNANTAFDGASLIGKTDIFLVKYSSEGVKQWTKIIGTVYADNVYDLVSNGTSLYVGGTTSDRPWSGGDYFNSALVMRCTMTGDLINKISWGTGYTYDSVRRMLIVPDGIICAQNCSVSGSVNFQSTMPKLQKIGFDLSKTTQPISVPSSFDTGSEYLLDLAKDSTGFYLLASTKTAYSGYSNAGRQDIYLCKYLFDGRLKWYRQWGSSTYDYVGNLAADEQGVYVTINTEGSIGGKTPIGGNDIYLIKLDNTGSQKSIELYGTPSSESLGGMAAWNGPIIAGSTNWKFMGMPMLGLTDIFIMKQ